ncbi:MAG: hypothetical protein AB7E80_13870 [Hyphomicrobiaceae bacterium]
MAATVVSLLALLFSGYSFYESVLRAPEIAVYVPPLLDYTDPDRPDSPLEVFIIPVTLANDGARSGTVLSIDLTVTNPRTGQSKRFYAARVGPWSAEQARPFTPATLAGKGSYSEAVQFFPRVGEDVARILDLEAGAYRLTLTLNTAAAAGPRFISEPRVAPLSFERQIGQLDYRNFNGRGTMEMWAADYRPSGGAN